MIDNRIAGKTISTLRQSRGMTQQQLAAALNVSHQAVSKWENGAALPDIQTLMELTQLFGVTVEQLLSGEIPQEDDEKKEERLRDIGKFVGGVLNDLGNHFRAEDKKSADAAEPEQQESGEKAKIDLQKMLQMAPFMSKRAVEDMLKESGVRLSVQDIARFAPFVSSAYLEELILASESEITWDTLRKVAPFLKKEVVDAFARAIAMGEKYVRPAARDMEKATEDLCRNLDEFSRKIGKGADKVVRKAVRFGENVVNEVAKAFEGLNDEPAEDASAERRARMRRAVFEKALKEEKWDWIEAHIGEIQDEILKKAICEKADECGMHAWLERNFSGYISEAAVKAAIEDGKWDWLGENIAKLTPELRQLTVQAALDAKNWAWLTEYADRAEPYDLVLDIAMDAYEAGEKMLAVQMVRYAMLPDELDELIDRVLSESDFEFIEMIIDQIPAVSLTEACAKLAEGGVWDAAKHFISIMDDDGIETLMKIAIDAGDFDLIDELDVLIRNADAEKAN